MSEVKARKHLRKMLISLTPGSVLHVLGEVIGVFAKEAQRDAQQAEQLVAVRSALFVLGLGIDAALPDFRVQE